MKKYLLFSVLLLLSASVVFSQEQFSKGLHFEHLPSWEHVLSKAKKENKLVLLYCYTTWCAPCKKMSTDIFPLKKVGSFYNAHYINAKVQIDSSANDDDDIKRWYPDANNITLKYEVTSFPTYLIFNEDGQILHRFSSSLDAESFIEKGKQALEPKNWYYPLLENYKKGDRTSEKIMQLGQLAREVGHDEKANELFNEYLAMQQTIFTQENLSLLYEITGSSMDRGFRIALDSAELADRTLGKIDASKDLVEDILVQETMPKVVGAEKEPDFTAIYEDLKSKYPEFADYVSSYVRMKYYHDVGEWNKYTENADQAIRHKKNKIPGYAIRNSAEIVFKNVNDKKLLEKALGWMEFLMNNKMHFSDMHIYANLLYKLGRTKDAIYEEKAVIQFAKEAKRDITLYETTLRKMEKGEPTW